MLLVRHGDEVRAEDVVDRMGGLAATFELRRAGVDRVEVSAALETRILIRARQGWYARGGTDDDLLAAARVGGRATCRTALAGLGVWTAPSSNVHVAVRSRSCQLRSPDDKRRRLSDADAVRVHWSERGGGTSRLRVGPVDALRHATACMPLEFLLASADSLLHRRPDLRRRWPELTGTFPRWCRRELASLDGVCESGTETLFWVRMRDRIPRLRRQVVLPGVGRVDFLVGARLVVEIDGAAYHTDSAQFERDRRRDAVLSASGFRALRFSYRQVMDQWPAVEAAVIAAVSRGDHL